jgi:hypothetical protein
MNTSALFTIIIIGVILVAIIKVFQSIQQTRELSEQTKKIPEFTPTQKLIGVDGKSGRAERCWHTDARRIC